MRIVRAALALAALAVAGGCLGDGGTVMLTADNQMGVSPTLTGFNASNATANQSSDGYIHFTASSAQGILTMLVVPPITVGNNIDLMQEHNFVSIDVPGPAGWSNNGGMIAVDGTNPYRLRFLAVPMIVGSGSAKGSFVFNGSGTFR